MLLYEIQGKRQSLHILLVHFQYQIIPHLLRSDIQGNAYEHIKMRKHAKEIISFEYWNCFYIFEQYN